jgi:hypothetical protein
VGSRAIYHAIYLFAWNALCADVVAIAKQGYKLFANIDDAMYHIGVTRVGHNYVVFANVLLADGAERYC